VDASREAQEIIAACADWVSMLPIVPLAYAAEDHTPVRTARLPYLEFGLHSGGGPATISIADESVRSRPGSLTVLNASFGNYGDPDDSWSFWCISLNLTSAPAPLRSWLEAPLLVNVPLNDPPRVTDAFLRLTRQFQLREGLHAIRLKSDFLGFLAELHENIGVNGTNDGRAWRKALDYIYRHYAESDLTLTAIARAAALSTSQLCRVFRAECGTTPMKYLTKVRVARACDLLRKTGQSIKEVAAAVGFSDPLHFSRVFRRSQGLPPVTFRDAERR